MAGKYDLNIDQGSAFRRRFTWTDDEGNPIDVTGYTATASIGKAEGGEAILSATNGQGITLGGAAGTIDLALTGAQTAGLDQTPYVWELVVSPDGTVDNASSLLKGQANVSAQVATP